jgi:hypothetical protein
VSTYLRDIASNALAKEAIPISTTATTVTGATQNFITGDGRCAALVQVSAQSSASTLTIFASESSDGTTFTSVTNGSTAITAAGIYIFTFDRTKQYLQFYNSITGSKTAAFGVTVIEQLKTY